MFIIAKFDPAFALARRFGALRAWVTRFLKRNRLTVRRITHRGTKRREDLQEVADAFASAVNTAVELEGVLSKLSSYTEKYSSLFNMDQTGVCIDSPGRLTVDYVGAENIDVVQGTAINGSRYTVFLCASATGEKLPPFIVFTGVPGGPVSKEVEAATFGDPSCAHTVQRKAWTDHDTMQKWINEVWVPHLYGCKLLLLDSLKVHKMASVRNELQNHCHTQVEYFPPGITGLSQPMDVSVMHSFKAAIERLYIEYPVDHPFPKTASDRRAMLSLMVAKAWAEITPATIITGFRKAHLDTYWPP
ncbi:Hypothetical protein PHPALM_20054 [Phytophthora palmivora]|uniref:DDE-1 domain-containing protein n=1 Tax=Phytophthora palmivora TaxID=4796 RepID=A0A2P4XFU6_9STRA|nr:Hypothetical protein PHPALM_20054 [Phytophthora palmivora]